MSWIKTIEYEESSGKLQKLYNRVKSPDGKIDNIMKVHSLRPNTMEGHMAIYKNVLHHSSNQLPKSLLEMLGVYVSMLNECNYCVEHHFVGFKKLLGDDNKAENIREALEYGDTEGVLTEDEILLMKYAEKLTKTPSEIYEDDIDELKDNGFGDGKILEVNQVVAYFNYANRTVLGLGVNLAGDVLGTSPGDMGDSDNWQHS